SPYCCRGRHWRHNPDAKYNPSVDQWFHIHKWNERRWFANDNSGAWQRDEYLKRPLVWQRLRYAQQHGGGSACFERRDDQFQRDAFFGDKHEQRSLQQFDEQQSQRWQRDRNV